MGFVTVSRPTRSACIAAPALVATVESAHEGSRGSSALGDHQAA